MGAERHVALLQFPAQRCKRTASVAHKKNISHLHRVGLYSMVLAMPIVWTASEVCDPACGFPAILVSPYILIDFNDMMSRCCSSRHRDASGQPAWLIRKAFSHLHCTGLYSMVPAMP